MIETTIPPAIAAIIPAIGGASDASAKPRPKGRAIRETTKPEKIFLGKSNINCLAEFTLFTLFAIYN
jgi:hypothetical protein